MPVPGPKEPDRPPSPPTHLMQLRRRWCRIRRLVRKSLTIHRSDRRLLRTSRSRQRNRDHNKLHPGRPPTRAPVSPVQPPKTPGRWGRCQGWKRWQAARAQNRGETSPMGKVPSPNITKPGAENKVGPKPLRVLGSPALAVWHTAQRGPRPYEFERFWSPHPNCWTCCGRPPGKHAVRLVAVPGRSAGACARHGMTAGAPMGTPAASQDRHRRKLARGQAGSAPRKSTLARATQHRAELKRATKRRRRRSSQLRPRAGSNLYGRLQRAEEAAEAIEKLRQATR